MDSGTAPSDDDSQLKSANSGVFRKVSAPGGHYNFHSTLVLPSEDSCHNLNAHTGSGDAGNIYTGGESTAKQLVMDIGFCKEFAEPNSRPTPPRQHPSESY